MFRDHEAAFLLPLADQRATIERVGGKGASLAQLARAGFPIPAGVHIATAAYESFVAANDLQRVLAANTTAGCADDPGSCERAASNIAAAFAAGTMPNALAQAIVQAYARLGWDGVFRRGALVSDGRGSAQSLVRRPTSDLPQYQRCRSAGGDHALLGFVVVGTRDLLPEVW